MKPTDLRESLSQIKEEVSQKLCARTGRVAERVKAVRQRVEVEGMLMERLAEGVEALGRRVGHSLEEEVQRVQRECREKICVERGKVREMDEAIEDSIETYRLTKGKFDLSIRPLDISSLQSAQSSLRSQFATSISSLQDQLAQTTISLHAEASSLAFSLPLPDPRPRLQALDSTLSAMTARLAQELEEAARTLNLSIE